MAPVPTKDDPDGSGGGIKDAITDWIGGWEGGLGKAGKVVGTLFGGPLAGAAGGYVGGKIGDFIDDSGNAKTVNDAFSWTPQSSGGYQGVGLPNTMLPSSRSSDPFAYRSPYDLGLTNPFQQPSGGGGQFLNNTWNAGSGVPTPNFLSGSGYPTQAQAPNQSQAMTGYGSRVPSAQSRTGYEQGRQINPQQQAPQMPRSFLGGLVGRDYHLLKGNG